MLTFENNDYDINGLFSLQINFEQLKFLLTSITKSLKQANQKIADLEEKMNNKEKKLDEVEKQSNNQDNFLSTKYKDFYSTKNNAQGGVIGKV